MTLLQVITYLHLSLFINFQYWVFLYRHEDVSFLSYIFILFMSPALEEILFRQLLQPIILSYIKNYIMAITALNILFVLIHYHLWLNSFNLYNIISLIGIFISGIIFSVFRSSFKQLIYVIMLHSYYNLCFLYFLSIKNLS